jgi:hypothetical protein
MIIFTLALLTSVGMYAQKGKTGPTSAEVQASKVIDYTNEVIDLNNEQIKELKNYNRVLTEAERAMERISTGKYDSRFPAPFSTQTTYRVQEGYFIKYDEAEKKAPVFAEKVEIIKLVANARETVNKLGVWSNKLGDYFTKKEFEKDEKYATYPVLVDSFKYYLSGSKKAWHAAVSKASDAGEAAEIIILKKSKIAQFIIPMKTNLKLLENAVDELYGLVNEDEISADGLATLKEHVTALSASLAKDKSVAGKNMALINHESDYTSFFEHGEGCAKYISLIIEELSKNEPNDDKLDSNFKMVKTEYDYVIKNYNYFAENGAK